MHKKIFLLLFIVIITTVSFWLFFNPPIFMQSSVSILQKANKLRLEGVKTQDDTLTRQAIDKYSIWLYKNKNNSDKKLIAELIRYRANAYSALNDINKAISEYKKSIQYYPSGDIQLGICLLEKQQGNLSVLHDCYVKAVEIFKNKNTSIGNLNYLNARIFSGDKMAIIEGETLAFRILRGDLITILENQIRFQTLAEDQQAFCAMALKELFDKAVYEGIVGKNYKIPAPFDKYDNQ